MVAGMKRIWLIVLLAGVGCDSIMPTRSIDLATPTFTAGQVAELQRRGKSAAELGIQMQVTEQSAQFGGVNVISGEQPGTVPLIKIPTDKPTEPGGQYRVPVVLATVNGKAGTRLMLDSGSNRILLGYSQARQLNIPPVAGVKPMTAMGIGGRVDNYLAVVPTLDVGGVRHQRLLALISPDTEVLKFTRGFWGNTPAMIYGVNTLRGLSYLSIDYLRGNVTFSPQAPYVPDPSLQTVAAVPLRWVEGLPAVEIQIDRRPDTYTCLLDTGGDYGMLVPRTVAAYLGYWKPGSERLGTSHGVAGAALNAQYNIRSVRLGGATFAGVPTRTDIIGPEPAGGHLLLGNVVLRRHRVTFDFRVGMLWLER